MNEKIKTVVFTVAVTAVFVFLVSGVNALLSDRIVANRTVARQKVILNLFGLAKTDSKLTDSEIPELFKTKTIRIATEKPAREIYRLNSSDSQLYVIGFSGQGFWDNISGYLAIDAAAATISGLEFTSHGETPGLGGRISEPEFKARFTNKKFGDAASPTRFRLVAEGSASRPDEIDGITGATGTSGAVEKILNSTIANFLELHKGGKLQ